jgi:hypothetical protein
MPPRRRHVPQQPAEAVPDDWAGWYDIRIEFETLERGVQVKEFRFAANKPGLSPMVVNDEWVPMAPELQTKRCGIVLQCVDCSMVFAELQVSGKETTEPVLSDMDQAGGTPPAAADVLRFYWGRGPGTMTGTTGAADSKQP